MKAITDYASSPLFPPEEKAVLHYADAITATPAEVPDEVYEEVSKFFNEAEIVELTSAIAWENYRARFDHALNVESQDFSEGAFCPLPTHRKE